MVRSDVEHASHDSWTLKTKVKVKVKLKVNV